jgi:hypothetical protein
VVPSEVIMAESHDLKALGHNAISSCGQRIVMQGASSGATSFFAAEWAFKAPLC